MAVREDRTQVMTTWCHSPSAASVSPAPEMHWLEPTFKYRPPAGSLMPKATTR